MVSPKKGNEALIYCSLLALQFGLQPVLSGIFFAKDVSKISIVIGTEIMKIIISLSTLAGEPEKKRAKVFANWSIQNSLKYAALPAILYAIQNLLIQYGYVYLDSMSYNLLSQTKTLSAAFWLWIVMGHRQSSMQIVALLLLLAAAVLLNLSSGTPVATSTTTNAIPSNTIEVFGVQGLTEYHLGVILCLSASSLSGLSGALVQTALVGKNAQNPFIYTAELALYGISFLLVTSMFMSSTRDKELLLSGRLFSNWTSHTFIPVTSNAMGGLIVGMVTKHAGGVVKGFAMIAGIIVTGLVQWMLYDKPLSLKDLIAVGLVSFSIYLHSSYPVNKSKPVLSQMALLISEDESSDVFLTRDISPKKSAQSYNEEAVAIANAASKNNNSTTANVIKSSSGGCPFMSNNNNDNNNNQVNPHNNIPSIRSARNLNNNTYNNTNTNSNAQDLGNDYGNFGSHDNLEQLKSQQPSVSNNSNNNNISRKKSKESLLQRAAASVSPSASFAELHHRTVVTVAQ